LPDEDELGDAVEDVLLVDALMGWEGDPCGCPDCDCPRFRDGASKLLCGDCLRGDHWPADVNA
jgi:hypothetical protein